MLSKIKIKNFRSIIDLDLDLNDTTNDGDKILPLTNLHGDIASGKSTLIKAISSFYTIITSSTGRIFGCLSGASNTKMEFEFYINKIKYNYCLIYNNASIVEETLIIDNKLLYQIIDGKFKKTSLKKVSLRSFSEFFKYNCVYEGQQHKTFLYFLENELPNADKRITPLYNFIKKFYFFSGQDLHSSIIDCNQDFVDELIKVLQTSNINIKNITLHQKPFSNQIQIKLHYKNDTIKLEEDSTGVQYLFWAAVALLKTLDNNSLLIIDSIDRFLPDNIIKNIINIFKSKNNKKTQVILTRGISTEGYKNNNFFIGKTEEKGTIILKQQTLKT